MTKKAQQLEILPPAKKMELTADGYIGYFQEYVLTSSFQPIFSFAHNSPIGYEALLRVTDIKNQSVPPSDLFYSIDDLDELLQLELISRNIHILNFFSENTDDALLFLNVNPSLINSSKFCLKQLLEMLNENNIPPTRIVIEFVEESYTDTEILIKASKYLKQSGCLIAIDDFGAGHSNFNRVWDLKPNIVKLDKSLIKKIRQDSWFYKPMLNLIELLHESESLVLIEGVEDESDAKLAHKLNLDLHQGYFFGKPKPRPFTQNVANYYINNNNKIHFSNTYEQTDNTISSHLKFLLSEAAMGTQATFDLTISCKGLLSHPSVRLCYLLNKNGTQISDAVYGEYSPLNLTHLYGKISNTHNVNWSRRIYFQRAISNPMIIQSTRPYLSLTSGQLCITLSMAIDINSALYVLCCDLKL